MADENTTDEGTVEDPAPSAGDGSTGDAKPESPAPDADHEG